MYISILDDVTPIGSTSAALEIDQTTKVGVSRLPLYRADSWCTQDGMKSSWPLYMRNQTDPACRLFAGLQRYTDYRRAPTSISRLPCKRRHAHLYCMILRVGFSTFKIVSILCYVLPAAVLPWRIQFSLSFFYHFSRDFPLVGLR